MHVHCCGGCKNHMVQTISCNNVIKKFGTVPLSSMVDHLYGLLLEEQGLERGLWGTGF